MLTRASISATTPPAQKSEVEEWSKRLADRMLRVKEKEDAARQALFMGFLEELIQASKTLGWPVYAPGGTKQTTPDATGLVKTSLVIDWFALDTDRPHFHALYAELRDKLGQPNHGLPQGRESHPIENLKKPSQNLSSADYRPLNAIVKELERHWNSVRSDLKNSNRYAELDAAKHPDGKRLWQFPTVTAWGIKMGKLQPTWQDADHPIQTLTHLGRHRAED